MVGIGRGNQPCYPWGGGFGGRLHRIAKGGRLGSRGTGRGGGGFLGGWWGLISLVRSWTSHQQ
ncbi:MAG: hypothetical protein EWV92_04975 [Microcystis aeruginosa Ma_MB_S_20031200_S102]|uniref:Uncharacterized protein n=1 Tax=Microcystis aeruginosa Ma_MB_S_20031200_S102 TaxID=2486254 RepID=A0A552F1T5_MICAE|nr:MAG: hypothetical protein EWV79_21180 [Microcystis aeruginosa Ma_MB_S_20031200_S102D]TRU40670.1 MAG: hypothetical protein EWV92_04975 [Microcystis aeruginosa Ma_MB_S_20031200_S102]